MNEFCPTCSGSGGIDVLDYSIGEVVTIPCPDCRGTGYDENNGIEDSRKASGGGNDGRLSNQD